MNPRALLVALALLPALPAMAQNCGPQEVQVQVLGSGGADLADRRAASSYLVWLEGKARVLVDVGSGAALRFREAGARVSDLDVILLSNLQSDSTVDLPALVRSSPLDERRAALPIYGPTESRVMPSTVTFVRTLFDSTRGAYRYLGDVLSPLARSAYKLEPHDVHERIIKLGLPRKPQDDILPVYVNPRVRISAVYVPHGQMPTLAWRIEAAGKTIVFSGDTSGEGDRLLRLARDADLFIVDHSVAEDASDAERDLSMPPSVIGRLARDAGAKQLVLVHRLRRTFGHESATFEIIRRDYSGPVAFANDLECFTP